MREDFPRIIRGRGGSDVIILQKNDLPAEFWTSRQLNNGLDQTFGPEITTPAGLIKPRMEGVVARAVLGNAEGQRAYLERLSQLYAGVFHVEAILKRVDELAAIIRPAIAQGKAHAAERHNEAVRRLKERIVYRDESLKQQLRDLGLLSDSPDKSP